ncbi:SDR family NAD(P)-dependent oxidoreductase [Jannaschia sp. W003]|uniref:SDR family NAD(P)-dependent oxidoreductase n=1 Tax=Jannaschia sp. W003 TaxID=2867012 RepID=UPI0021A697E2|nr:SDR family NAD(P)-dependent oxidoreductase [Jannaschia sp. W003]UWQ21538.1 SDR family NAD(P)-dependent oxidoreductase [Jannaschia sp. W003]
MQIEEQVALVTGGGSGLGAATARHLAGRGARVAILERDAARGGAVAAEVDGWSTEADVADEASVAAAVDAAAAHFGAPARIVVNCAGIATAARILGREGEVSVDLFRRVIDVNLVGTYVVMSHALRALRDAEPLGEERGVIVNTASAAYQDGQVGQAAYAASKGGVASMCLPLARELARMGVRVCAIAPGLFATPMMESLPEETVDGIVRNVPFPPRLGDPEEFGRLVAAIVENAYLNGETIRLDGAARLPPR